MRVIPLFLHYSYFRTPCMEWVFVFLWKHAYKSRFGTGIFGSYIRGSLISVGHSELKQGFGTAGSCSYKRVSLLSVALISVVHCRKSRHFVAASRQLGEKTHQFSARSRQKGKKFGCFAFFFFSYALGRGGLWKRLRQGSPLPPCANVCLRLNNELKSHCFFIWTINDMSITK